MKLNSVSKQHTFFVTTFVDDGLKSVVTVKEAITLTKNAKQMCKSGGFNLHKFISNHKDVIKSIPESDRAEGVKELDLDSGTFPLERTLGVQWCIESDSSLASYCKTSLARGEAIFLVQFLIHSDSSHHFFYKESPYYKTYAFEISDGTTPFQTTQELSGKPGNPNS